MNVNYCSICKKPIIGYFHEIGKNAVCQSCSAFTTVYDLYQRGILEIKPDIVETDAIHVGEPIAENGTAENSDSSACGHYYGEINECMLEEEKNQEA